MKSRGPPGQGEAKDEEVRTRYCEENRGAGEVRKEKIIKTSYNQVP